MNPSSSKAFKFKILLLLSLLCFCNCASASATTQRRTEHAYVTLLYGDEFVLGVRVLGKSIRNTKSDKDLVVLASDGVSNFATQLLEADGWKVEKISLLANPNQVRPKRFWGVYTKLKIFNMTDYRKVIYLDADTIIVKNIEELFKCGKFCANLKHSERLNSGVLVVEPSEQVFNDMMSKINFLPSYTGGDQGFLNSYYIGFANAHLFEPDLPQELLDSRQVPEMERLSTLYNADVGLYMLADKWMVDEKELRVIHYTLGPLKPWDWWTSWLVKPVDIWQAVREQLEDSLPGTGRGRNPNDELLVKVLFVLPFSIMLFCFYRTLLQRREFSTSFCAIALCENVRHLLNKIRCRGAAAYTSISQSTTSNSTQQFSNGLQSMIPKNLGGVSVFICFMTAFVSLGLAFAIIPRQVTPWTGLLLMYEWTFTFFFLLFSGYLQLIHQLGKRRASQTGSFSNRTDSLEYNSGKGHQRYASSCNINTWLYGLVMAFFAIVAPSLPAVFGITALFLRLGLMIGGGIILASFMTYASEHLAIRSFVSGLEDRDLDRNKSLCLLH